MMYSVRMAWISEGNNVVFYAPSYQKGSQ